MEEVSVIIPNYNGKAYIRGCLDALFRQSIKEFEIIAIDNGSTDGSSEIIAQEYPDVRLLCLDKNYGFCRAVNEGIRASQNPYVLLLNNDTEAEEYFVEEMLRGIKKNKKCFSCQAKLIQFYDRTKTDDAGNFYSALGWAYAKGKGEPESRFQKERTIFAACGGAAVYRKSLMKKIGYFDEEHFAYLEDLDIGYRARIYGYQNLFLPSARVYHVGSGTSGSRYNSFKVRCSARNNIYLLYKNMPVLQIIWNFPLLLLGFVIKVLFFVKKGFGKEYLTGMKEGIFLCLKNKKNVKKVPFLWKNIGNYLKIQGELYLNILRKFK